MLGSGATAGLPLLLKVLVEPPRLLPDLATSFRRDEELVGAGCGVVAVEVPAESGREVEFDATLEARNVRFTETDLKLWGFLTVEELRA